MTQNPIRVYADTSVFGGVFDEEFAIPSRAFFDQVRAGKFHLILSPVIEEEIRQAPEEVRNFHESVASVGEMLPLAEEAIRLQEAYLRAGIVSERWAADALHVAHATVSACRVVVSWNFEHIVHYKKIPLYNAISVKEGFAPLAIHTPQEVIEYEDKDL